ncbi:MAG: ArsR family transcriptional regulator [Candidatus Abyssobacteria bacterium SURF_17]|uniref:ArsR family transcriptional regulator n=1 Tax=Candidatus Abyssobacteria bacterium SURF_17 TaxID=2093361 RepID=A0A419ENW1_9BACT|nr:MAG: ArsR family transcriptional regulator [Candidatus Abyssubacteria bacterium SURF_17]
MSREQLTKVFKALGNENRLKILEAIRSYQLKFANCPDCLESLDMKDGCVCCVDEIGEQFEMAQSTISQHLKELHNAGLLERRKKGKWVYYTINPEVVQELFAYLESFRIEMAKKE